MTSGGVSVIDVGSNSTNHLLVDERGKVLERTILSTRLGQGLHEDSRLSDDGIRRTVDAVARHAAAARSVGVDRIVVVGTAACRRARNTGMLSDAIVETTGLALNVLGETEEARASFVGALSDLPDIAGSTLVVDIGGGSTEYAIGPSEPEFTASIPFGAVTSTGTHLESDPPRPESLTNLIGAVCDEIEEMCRESPTFESFSRVVGVAGTVTTVAAVELGLATFDPTRIHGMLLSRAAAEDVFRTVATEPLVQRRLNPGLDDSRADIIVAGCCILVATMRRLRIDEMVVSVGGLLDGIAMRERLTG